MTKAIQFGSPKGFAALLAVAFAGVAGAVETYTFTGEKSEGIACRVEACPAFTFTAWVKPEGFMEGNPYPRIFQVGNFYLHLSESFSPAGAGFVAGMAGLPKTKESPRGASSWETDQTIPLGVWSHVAIVVRPSAKCRPELYLNGRRCDFGGALQPLPSPFPAGTYTIGNTAVGGNRAFKGQIAGAERVPCVLSPDQIAALAKCDPDGKAPGDLTPKFDDRLPIVDIADDASRQVVIAAGTPEIYQGHPTTVVADDGTMFCVWTIRHGGPCGPMARSTDGGKTWTRCDELMPPEYKRHSNCPTLQRIPRKDGGTNLAVFSNTRGGCGIVLSEDNGKTWKAAPVAALSAGMPPTGLVPLKDGSVALFGQIRNNRRVKTDRPTDDQSIWMSVSRDAGWTWGPMRIVAKMAEKNLCEPFALRSPDGQEIALLMRENRHRGCSMMCFSRDEGATWTKPVDTCWGLSGDRHEGAYLPDGRLLVAFRDRAIGASTYGQYMGWVGSYDDLRHARPGDFRVHLLHHLGKGGFGACDTGYSGVEVLKDGSIVCTTYMRYWNDSRKHSVVSTRFTMSDLKR